MQQFCSALDLSLFDLYFSSGTLKKEIFPVSSIEEISLDKEFPPSLVIIDSGLMNAENFHLQ